jgi:hypothetical protein
MNRDYHYYSLFHFTDLAKLCGDAYAKEAKWVRVDTFVRRRDSNVCGKVVVRRYKDGEMAGNLAHLAVVRLDGHTEHYHYSPAHLEAAWEALPYRIGVYSLYPRNLLGRELIIPQTGDNRNTDIVEIITRVSQNRSSGLVTINDRREEDLFRKAWFIHQSGLHIPFGIPLIDKNGNLEEPLDYYSKKGGEE